MSDQTETNFNDEVIWDNSKNLFDIYFKEGMVNNASRFAYFPIEEAPFDFNMAVMGFQTPDFIPSSNV